MMPNSGPRVSHASWRHWVLAGLLALAVPGLVRAERVSSAQPKPAVGLFNYSRSDAQYTALDPLTLDDRSPVTAGSLPWPFGPWLVSADGSTRVQARYPEDGLTPKVDKATIIVADGARGQERLRIDATDLGGPIGISRDGTRLVTMTGQSGSDSGVSQPTWYAIDTRDGGVLATIAGEGQGFGPYGFLTSILDPDGRFLYRPFIPGDRAGDSPLPLQIVANDLQTGEEVARISLTDVQAESWWPERVEQVPVNRVMAPAVALSPDGAQIAVVHAEADRVTILDARTLTVERTLKLKESRSLTDRARGVLGWLGLVPQAAEAKLLTGRVLSAVYAPDGRSLYLAGREGRVGETTDSVEEWGLGLRRIDLTNGEIVAKALGNDQVDDVVPTPDGNALYVSGPTVPWAMNDFNQSSYRLSRLDPETLEPLAQRELAERPVVLPMSSPD